MRKVSLETSPINSIGFVYYRSPDILCYARYLFSFVFLKAVIVTCLFSFFFRTQLFFPPPDLEVWIPVTSLTIITTSLLFFSIYNFVYNYLKSLKNLEEISCPNHSVGRLILPVLRCCCAGCTCTFASCGCRCPVLICRRWI